MLLVTHDVDEAIALADRAIVLDDGRVRADIPIAPLPLEPSLRETRRAALRSTLLELLGVGQDGGPLEPPAEPVDGAALRVLASSRPSPIVQLRLGTGEEVFG